VKKCIDFWIQQFPEDEKRHEKDGDVAGQGNNEKGKTGYPYLFREPCMNFHYGRRALNVLRVSQSETLSVNSQRLGQFEFKKSLPSPRGSLESIGLSKLPARKEVS
jgi:hypothetical protein